MSEKQAKRKRQETRAQGIDPNPAPVHNFTDRPDTRHDRRLKRCRPKVYAKQLKDASFLDRMMHWAKWRAAFGAVPGASQEIPVQDLRQEAPEPVHA